MSAAPLPSPGPRPRSSAVRRTLYSPGFGLAVAITTPIAGSVSGLPPVVFDHLAVLFVVGVAMAWGMAPAVTGALSAALGNNYIVHGEAQRALSEFPDLLDLTMFVVVAVAVGWLVSSARRERARAEAAAARERQAREERDRLVSAVTHDLATPLGVIRGNVQIARRGRGRRPLDLDRLLVRLDAAASRATSLIRTLSDVRSLDAGALSLNRRPTDLRALAETVVHMMDEYSDRHPVALAVPPQPVMVDCDHERLQRVLENLVSNAMKYSPDGGPIEVALSVEAGQAAIAVRDQGLGIPESSLPHIFERGYRAPEAAATAPGLGLGLAIAAEFVKRHAGTIEAQRAQPSGSLFVVRLPLARQASEPIPFGRRLTG